MFRSSVTILVALLVLFQTDPADASEMARRALPEVHGLPVTTATAVPIGLPGRNDKQGTLLAGPGDGFMLVFNSGLGANIDDLQLYAVVSTDGYHIGPTEKLELIDAPFVAQPSFMTLADKHWLYFATAESLRKRPQIWRAELSNGRFSAAELQPHVPNLVRMTGWPRWSATDNGKIVVSFRDGKSRPAWSVHEPDETPRTRVIENVGAAYVRVVPMTGGGWLLSYQHQPNRQSMLTYIQVSDRGKRWSPAVPISVPSWPHVHDAFALPRRTSGVDVYYSYPSLLPDKKACFGLYRRAVLGPRRFGPEEQVTVPGDVCAYSASAHRLQDGKVLITFSNIIASGPNGVVEAQNYIARLNDDAAAPQ